MLISFQRKCTNYLFQTRYNDDNISYTKNPLNQNNKCLARRRFEYVEIQAYQVWYISNKEGMVNDIYYASHLGKSDNICLVLKANMYASTVEKMKPRQTYHMGIYQNMIENLNKIDLCKRLQNIRT